MHAVQFLIVRMNKINDISSVNCCFICYFYFTFGYEMNFFVIGSVEKIHRNQTVWLAISCCG